jgi:hypothetical protein
MDLEIEFEEQVKKPEVKSKRNPKKSENAGEV